jgi:hypothetical protein
MSIATKLARVYTATNNIRDALDEKGVNVIDLKLEDYADSIRGLELNAVSDYDAIYAQNALLIGEGDPVFNYIDPRWDYGQRIYDEIMHDIGEDDGEKWSTDASFVIPKDVAPPHGTLSHIYKMLAEVEGYYNPDTIYTDDFDPNDRLDEIIDPDGTNEFSKHTTIPGTNDPEYPELEYNYVYDDFWHDSKYYQNMPVPTEDDYHDLLDLARFPPVSPVYKMLHELTRAHVVDYLIDNDINEFIDEVVGASSDPVSFEIDEDINKPLPTPVNYYEPTLTPLDCLIGDDDGEPATTEDVNFGKDTASPAKNTDSLVAEFVMLTGNALLTDVGDADFDSLIDVINADGTNEWTKLIIDPPGPEQWPVTNWIDEDLQADDYNKAWTTEE